MAIFTRYTGFDNKKTKTKIATRRPVRAVRVIHYRVELLTLATYVHVQEVHQQLCDFRSINPQIRDERYQQRQVGFQIVHAYVRYALNPRVEQDDRRRHPLMKRVTGVPTTVGFRKPGGEDRPSRTVA